MKLLAFDCEFATCKSNNFIICEFGYVLFDEDLKEIARLVDEGYSYWTIAGMSSSKY